MKFVKEKPETLPSAEGIIQLCWTAGAPGAGHAIHPMRDFSVISLFHPVIFGRFPTFALISLQICILTALTSHDAERRKSSALPSRRSKTGTLRPMRLCWDRFAPAPRNAPMCQIPPSSISISSVS
jgi:hypothetical protein